MTTGLTTAPDYYDCTTHVASIPAYHKYEFDISGLSENGLNGLKSNSTTGSTFEVYDTKDYTRVGSIDLSTLHDYMTWDSEYGWALDTTHISNYMEALESGTSIGELGCLLTQQYMTFDGDPAEHILYLNNGDSTNKPTGTMLYPLETPVATGSPAFEPIALKSGDTWVVDDMGSEYFIQPANTNCPVNQVSYYYENLKDKLVNLEMPEVEAIGFNKNNNKLEGLNINGNRYKNIPFYIAEDNQSISVGQNATSYGQYSTSFGYNASGSANYSVVIGRNSLSGGNGGIALGANVQVYYPNLFMYDGNNNNWIRTLCSYSPNYIFFRNEHSKIGNPMTPLNGSDNYPSGHYLSEYIQNNALVLQDGKYYISYTDADNFKTFSNNRISGTDTDITSTVKGVHITVKVSGTTSHSVVGLDLLPYDSTNSYGFDSYGRVAVDGVVQDILATIDSAGCVVITLATGTIDSVTYNLK